MGSPLIFAEIEVAGLLIIQQVVAKVKGADWIVQWDFLFSSLAIDLEGIVLLVINHSIKPRMATDAGDLFDGGFGFESKR
jgi:hypothetical protein